MAVYYCLFHLVNFPVSTKRNRYGSHQATDFYLALLPKKVPSREMRELTKLLSKSLYYFIILNLLKREISDAYLDTDSVFNS